MKILVTGATGFVGRAIIKELSDDNKKKREIYCMGNINSDFFPELPNLFKVDICEPETFSGLEIADHIDVVIHSAGLAHQFKDLSEDGFFKINVAGTQNILEFASERSVKHFILISSVSVYGDGNNALDDKNILKKNENENCRPESAYAKSKLKAEEISIKFCEDKNISLTILRLSTVIGEEDRGNVFRLIRAMDKRRFIMIGKGENYKTLIYKKDAARAVREIVDKKDFSLKSAEIFNVGAEPIQMKSVVNKISQTLGKRKTNVFIPLEMTEKPLKIFSRIIPASKIKKITETIAKWTSNEIFSSEKIRQKYFFVPETAISEAIEREVVFYKNQKC